MKKVIIGILVATMFFGVVTGVFAQKEIKLGHIAAPNTAYDNWAKEFKRQVEEATNNKYKIVIYGGGQLGGSTALMEGLQAGNIQLAVITTSDMNQFVKEIDVLDMPFLFRNWDHVEKFLASDVNRKLLSLGDQYGLHNLSSMPRGYRHLTTSAKVGPITKPEDLKGVKMRVAESPLYIDIFKALGANAQAMAWGEVYTALQQGTVNAHENTIVTTRDYKINEVQKYMSETGHTFAFGTLMAGLDWFKKLPANDQAVFQKAADDSAVKLGIVQKNDEANAKAELIAKGMIFNSVDTAPFIARVKPVIEKYAKGDMKRFYDQIVAIH